MKKLIVAVLILFISAQVYAQDGQLAEVNGVSIYYEVHGEGEPLVLLHGFTMSHEMWDGWIEDLSKDYRLILADLRGHGHSTNPSRQFSHRDSAQDIYGLMDALGIDKFHGMGFSSGAMTLTHMAVLDSTRIESMVLIGSTSYYPEATRQIQRGISYESLDKNWMSSLKEWHPGGEEQIRMLLSQFRSFSSTYEDMNFTPSYLASIKTPTLIIHGDRDPFFSVDIPVISYNSMPNSYLWIVPNFGHSGIDKGTIWDNAFLATINQFFSGDWSE